ncbi:hypothetical protein KA107_02100 [Candidatus Pacearchaeota archaeon]|nr:hypothetical protein [Candidatus Pacearchaeota archaeon]
MRFTRKLLVAGIISLAYYVFSLFLNIVPCQISPNVPNPQYLWGFCTLNPDSYISSGVQKIFFGFSSRLTDATIIALVVPFVLAILVLSLKLKKHKKEE